MSAPNPSTPEATKRTPKCKPCGDSGFVFPKPSLRHYCGCLKGIQRLRESHDDMLAALKSIIPSLEIRLTGRSKDAGAFEILNDAKAAVSKAERGQ